MNHNRRALVWMVIFLISIFSFIGLEDLYWSDFGMQQQMVDYKFELMKSTWNITHSFTPSDPNVTIVINEPSIIREFWISYPIYEYTYAYGKFVYDFLSQTYLIFQTILIFMAIVAPVFSIIDYWRGSSEGEKHEI